MAATGTAQGLHGYPCSEQAQKMRAKMDNIETVVRILRKAADKGHRDENGQLVINVRVLAVLAAETLGLADAVRTALFYDAIGPVD